MRALLRDALRTCMYMRTLSFSIVPSAPTSILLLSSSSRMALSSSTSSERMWSRSGVRRGPIRTSRGPPAPEPRARQNSKRKRQRAERERNMRETCTWYMWMLTSREREREVVGGDIIRYTNMRSAMRKHTLYTSRIVTTIHGDIHAMHCSTAESCHFPARLVHAKEEWPNLIRQAFCRRGPHRASAPTWNYQQGTRVLGDTIRTSVIHCPRQRQSIPFVEGWRRLGCNRHDSEVQFESPVPILDKSGQKWAVGPSACIPSESLLSFARCARDFTLCIPSRCQRDRGTAGTP